MQWLIDIIKDWIIEQGYATIAYVDAEISALKAWIEAQFYLQKSEYPGYGMPVHVTGILNPDVTCTYFRCGDYNGKPCYSQADGSYFIFWGVAFWYIGTVLGGAPPSHLWRRSDPDVFGAYTPIIPSTGSALVTSGYKYLLESFIDRGDPAASDWDHTNLTLDGAFHDLDLSAIVPKGAKLVLFGVLIRDNLVNSLFTMKKKGIVNVWNVSTIKTQAGNIWNSHDGKVAVDETRIIEYVGTNGLSFIYLSIRGWWF